MNIQIRRRQWAGAAEPRFSLPSQSKNRYAIIQRLSVFAGLVASDVACVLLGFLGAGLLRAEPISQSNTLLVIGVTLPVYLVTALNARAYASDNLQDPFRAIGRALQSLALSVTAIIFVAYFLKASTSFPRLSVTLGTIISLLLLTGSRYLFVKWLLAHDGINPLNVMLIVDGDAQIPIGDFRSVVGADTFFDPETSDPMMYDRFARSLAGVDRVVITCPTERRMAWASALKGANIQGEIIVPELIEIAPLGMSSHGGVPSLIVATGPLKFVDRALKRAFDLAVSCAAIVLLLPLFAVVALMIKLDSPGPVLFTQPRIGRGNQLFRMKKFRSLRTESCDGAASQLTTRNDNRVTRVGKFIRATSIDELPQLLNVLRGDMSIVGPRPHALGAKAADKLYWEVDARYWQRHAAKPGITGLAQVRGFRGNTVRETDLNNRLQADLEYLENWSIWRDIGIIFSTFRVLVHNNAF